MWTVSPPVVQTVGQIRGDRLLRLGLGGGFFGMGLVRSPLCLRGGGGFFFGLFLRAGDERCAQKYGEQEA